MTDMTNDKTEDRIVELEILNAEQTRLTEELSSLVAKQQDQIDALERRLDILVTRFVVVEEQVQPDIPVDKPPHY